MANTPKKPGIFSRPKQLTNPTLQPKETVMSDESEIKRPWRQASQDPKLFEKVQAYRLKLEDQIEDWGDDNGISDLKLQHLQTMPKNPDAEVSHFWNPHKSEWYRYREGDEVPRWLLNLPNRNDYKYPNGKELTPEILAKFKGRGSKEKKFSLK